MPDLTELPGLPDLAREVSERVVVPSYDEVKRRLQARRRRSGLAALAGVVVVIAGLAVWQDLSSSPGTHDLAPAHTSPSPLPMTDEKLWQEVVDGTQAHPFEIAGGADGSVAVVWRALEQPAPTFALVIRTADGTVHGIRLLEPLTLAPLPGGGWIGTDNGYDALIGSDGTMSQVDEGGGRPLQPGDVSVWSSDGLLLYAPLEHRLYPPVAPGGAAYDQYVTPGGRLVSCVGDGTGYVTVSTTEDGTHWDKVDRVRGSSCLLDGHDDTVALVALGDSADGSVPLAWFSVSTDGGRTWADPPRQRLTDVSSMAVASDGTTIVSGAGRAFLYGTRSGYSEPGRPIGVVFAAGDQLCATSYGQDKGPMLCSGDDGVTWQETTLPGLG